MSDDQSTDYAHRNTGSHFVNKFDVPIELEGTWDIGLSEVDIFVAKKDINRGITLALKTISLKLDATDPLMKNELSPTPYNLTTGEKYQIVVPASTEGITSIGKKFKKDYASNQFIDFIEFNYGLEYLKITSTPFESPTGTWNYVVLDETSNWNLVFNYSWNLLNDWRWYTKLSTDEIVSHKSALSNPDIIADQLLSGVTTFSKENRIDQIRVIDEGEDNYKLRVSNSTKDIPLLRHSAIHEGALYLPSSSSQLYVDANTESVRINKFHMPTHTYETSYNPDQDAEPLKDLSQLIPKEIYLKRTHWKFEDSSDYWLIYCSIIEDSPIGNTIAPILRIIPYNSWFCKEDHIHLEFNPIYYKRVLSSRINSVRVLIANSIGQFVKFDGHVRLVCKLRQVA